MLTCIQMRYENFYASFFVLRTDCDRRFQFRLLLLLGSLPPGYKFHRAAQVSTVCQIPYGRKKFRCFSCGYWLNDQYPVLKRDAFHTVNMYPFSKRSSERYDPSSPVTPVINATWTFIKIEISVQPH